MVDIQANIAEVLERIEAAAARVGRDGREVTLVAVSKTHPPEVIVAAYEAGLRHFGENRPEEGRDKIPQVLARLSGPVPTWHMVGHIQSRKARDVVAFFDVVHSVDRLKIARRLSRFAQQSGRTIPILLECNISGEVTKYGFAVDRWEEDALQRNQFLDDVAQILTLPALRVEGLMTMAPIVPDPEMVRPLFRRLRALRDFLADRFPDASWHHLSMGMTDDFEVAVEEGATMVRIGRAIFGPRYSL
ncbi:MAG: YggS family pyridoxal phosphate-dependent enzyme [Chloroflexi bacterium]|nr:MAG: YggS family pyridoxal phosphate-dependent enzyme [Chloroflexota bacterium]